nr:hypothetical protein [Phenylobacterium sp.]
QIDGVVLSKLDGDARGGAALSVKEGIGRPIAFASTGEKLDAFELWRQLSLLPKTYEDVWREWFLPTALGEMASAP